MSDYSPEEHSDDIDTLPGHEHDDHDHEHEHEHEHDDKGAKGGGGSDVDDKPAKAARGKLSLMQLATNLVKAAKGGKLTKVEARQTRRSLEGLSNEQFSVVIKFLDKAGLKNMLQALYGHDASQKTKKEVEVPVVCWRFWNAKSHIRRDVKRAQKLYKPHKIFVVKASERTITKAQTKAVVGHDVDDNFKLERGYGKGTGTVNRFTHADMQKVLKAYIPTSVIGGLWVKNVVRPDGTELAGTSAPEFVFGAGYHKLAAVATDHSGKDSFAHEMGHILFDEGHSGARKMLMRSGGDRHKNKTGKSRITDAQATKVRNSALVWVRKASK